MLQPRDAHGGLVSPQVEHRNAPRVDRVQLTFPRENRSRRGPRRTPPVHPCRYSCCSTVPLFFGHIPALIDQHVTRRRRPAAGRIFATNEGPLTGTDGGTLARVDRSGHTLILSADHLDKTTYPTRTFEIKAATLLDILVGEVVWVGRHLGSHERR